MTLKDLHCSTQASINRTTWISEVGAGVPKRCNRPLNACSMCMCHARHSHSHQLNFKLDWSWIEFRLAEIVLAFLRGRKTDKDIRMKFKSIKTRTSSTLLIRRVADRPCSAASASLGGVCGAGAVARLLRAGSQAAGGAGAAVSLQKEKKTFKLLINLLGECVCVCVCINTQFWPQLSVLFGGGGDILGTGEYWYQHWSYWYQSYFKILFTHEGKK